MVLSPRMIQTADSMRLLDAATKIEWFNSLDSDSKAEVAAHWVQQQGGGRPNGTPPSATMVIRQGADAGATAPTALASVPPKSIVLDGNIRTVSSATITDGKDGKFEVKLEGRDEIVSLTVPGGLADTLTATVAHLQDNDYAVLPFAQDAISTLMTAGCFNQYGLAMLC